MNEPDHGIAMMRLRHLLLTALMEADQLRLYRVGIALDHGRVILDAELTKRGEPAGPETIFG